MWLQAPRLSVEEIGSFISLDNKHTFRRQVSFVSMTNGATLLASYPEVSTHLRKEEATGVPETGK